MDAEYLVDSCVWGYHYYQNIWDPFIGEVLRCVQDRNPHDRYAVAVHKSGCVVGHVSKRISTLCYMLLRRSGAKSCAVTGTRRYSYNLQQGGMEIPCQLKFSSDDSIDYIVLKTDWIRITCTTWVLIIVVWTIRIVPKNALSDTDMTRFVFDSI